MPDGRPDGIISKTWEDWLKNLLHNVADVIKRSFRPVDHVCRISSSRFAVIMSRVDSSIKDQVTQKIDHVNHSLKIPYKELPVVSLAVGVAFADRVSPGDSMLEDAEDALFSLKEGGVSGCAFH